MKKNYLYEDVYRGVRYWKVRYDVNGNPRYVVHFLDLVSDQENDNFDDIEDVYKLARMRAARIGGQVYRAKWFGGGILFQTFDMKQTIDKIIKLRGE